jgi:hypothetical protein
VKHLHQGIYKQGCHEVLSYPHVVQYIQDVSGGKVNILGGHNISHSKQKSVCTCPIPNSFRDRAISLYSSKIVYKKEILHTVSNASIYCSSAKVGTDYPV